MRRFLSLLINTLLSLVALTLCARLLLRFDAHGAPVGLSPDGGEYLKYFTVLSNLLAGAASALYVLGLQLKLCGVLRRVPGWIRRLKYAAACALGLTFTMVLLIIGPRSGFQGAYEGPNLWFHLILPIAALLDFALLDREGRITLRQTLLALPLPALYGAAYLGNLMVNGYGGRTHPNDWYDFAAGGPAGVPLTLLTMLALGWGVAALLRLPRRKPAAPAGGERDDARFQVKSLQ